MGLTNRLDLHQEEGIAPYRARTRFLVLIFERRQELQDFVGRATPNLRISPAKRHFWMGEWRDVSVHGGSYRRYDGARREASNPGIRGRDRRSSDT